MQDMWKIGTANICGREGEVRWILRGKVQLDTGGEREGSIVGIGGRGSTGVWREGGCLVRCCGRGGGQLET